MSATNIATTRAERIQELGFDYAAQPKTWAPFCNLCGSERAVILTHEDRYGYPASAVVCHRCGCTALNPRMTPAAYGEFYERVYRPLVSAYHGRLIDAKTIQAEQVPYAAAMADFCRPFLTTAHTSMLDVGGSTGVISVHFSREFGLKCTVIDPAPSETAEAQSLGVEAITGFMETWDPQGRTFDVVGMFQTIDHLLDVASTFEKIRKVLPAWGLFVVDIVDFRAAYLRNNSVEAAVKIDHVYSLTQEVVEAYFARFGFKWVRKSYSADHLHVVYICEVCAPDPNALPDPSWVEQYFQEVRKVQNTP